MVRSEMTIAQLFENYPSVMKLEEIASVLRIHRGTVTKWAQRGEIKRRLFSNKARYLKEDVIEYLQGLNR